jgi:hypothetical protein
MRRELTEWLWAAGLYVAALIIVGLVALGVTP